MKKLSFIMFLLLSCHAFAQLDFLSNPYTNCLQSEYDLNQMISMCSVEGNYATAIKLLDSDAWQKRKQERYLSYALLKFNLNGKAEAYNYLAELQNKGNVSSDELLIIKMWLTYYTKHADFEDMKSQALTKSSNHLALFKLMYKELSNDRFSFFGSSNEKKVIDLEKQIEFLLKKGCSTQDSIFLYLTKCEIIDHDDWRKCELIDIVETLVIKYNDYLYRDKLLRKIDDCKSAQCAKIIEQLTDINLNALNTYSSIIKTKYIIDEMVDDDTEEDSTMINKLEQNLTTIINQEKDSIEQEKIYGLIKYLTLNSSMRGLGLFQSPSLNETRKLVYSLAFKQSIKSKITKPNLLDIIFAIADSISRLAPELSEKIDKKKLTDVKELETMTREDMSLLVGMTQDIYFMTKGMLVFAKSFSNDLQVAPSKTERANWTNFKPFLVNNPLFYETSISYSYPEIDTEDKIEQGIKTIDDILTIYPGAKHLYKTKLNLYEEFLDKNLHKATYLNQWMLTLVTMLSKTEITGDAGDSKNDIDNLFTIDTEANKKKYFAYAKDGENFKYLWNLLSTKQKTAISTLIENNSEKPMIEQLQRYIQKYEY